MTEYLITRPDGRKFKVNAASPERAKSAVDEMVTVEPKPNFLGGLAANVSEGALLGFGDEIAAGIQAGLGKTNEGGFFDFGGDLGSRFDENVANQRSAQKQFAEENPITAGAAQIGGAILPALATGGASTIPRAIATGAIEGGITGVGQAEGDLADRALPGVAGTVAGGVLGGATKSVFDVLSPLFRGASVKARRKLASALKADNVTPEQAVARMERAQRVPPGLIVKGDNQTPTPLALFDVADDSTRGVARTAAVAPGPGRSIQTQFIEKRNEQQVPRIMATAQRILGSADEAAEAVAETTARRAEAAEPAYRAAYNATLDLTEKQASTLSKAISTPTGTKVIKAARDAALDAGEDPANPMVLFDYAKRQLDDMIDSSVRKETPELTRRLMIIKNNFVNPLKAANKAYATALDDYAGESAMISAVSDGRRFLRGSADDVITKFRGMGQGEKDMFRLGVVKEIRDSLESKADGADAVKRIFGTKKKRDLLRQFFPNSKTFRQFQSQMLREAKMRKTRDFISPNVGSRTGFIDAETQAGGIADSATGAAVDALSGGVPVSSITEGVKSLLKTRDMSPAVAREVARIATLTDPQQVAQELGNLAGRSDVTGQVVSQIAAILSGGAAGSLGNP